MDFEAGRVAMIADAVEYRSTCIRHLRFSTPLTSLRPITVACSHEEYAEEANEVVKPIGDAAKAEAVQ